ncbi:MAG: vWA domain-containing protein [Syntrophales bacterium]|nr:vWA domain-containing protein [Syntrophales bacterium]
MAIATECISPLPPPEVKKRGKYEEHEDTLSILPGFEFEGISAFWRKNVSFIEATELANILRALRKVAGHIGQNVGRIEWAGMSHAGEEAIVLDPDVVLGCYPVPFRRIDYLVGIVTHEALHRTEWTELVWKKIEEASKNMGLTHKIILQKIVYTGEDIYVDCISDKSILSLYTRAARSIAMEEARLLLKSKAVTVEELIYLWWVSVWKEFEETEILPVYQGPLAILQGLTDRLKEVHQQKKSVTDRCVERYHLYRETWENIKDIIASWQIMDRSLLWSAPTEEAEVRPKKPPPKAALSDAEVQQIETKLAYDSTDITPIIRSIVGDDVDIVPISRWDFNMPAHPVVDHHLAARLKLIFETYADREILPSRGLVSGKVDRRRLYRAPINGRCFFEKQSLPKMDWNICLLMDASGSMAGPKWRMVENVVGTIHRAFRGFGNRLQAYGYFEVEGVCLISKLRKGSNLLSIPPAGKTATGQAIIAAAYFMPRMGGRSFIIHVTDGESNLGCDVHYGIDYCKRRNIHLVTLGCGYKNREVMLKQYGKAIQFLDHFDQLPSAMEKLLRWIIIYGLRK